MEKESLVIKLRLLTALVAGVFVWIIAGKCAGWVMKTAAANTYGVNGTTLLIYSFIELLLITGGMALCLRLAGMRFTDIGLTDLDWKKELVTGLLAGTVMALLQFLILLPLTGGAGREDVIAGLRLMGTGCWNILAMIVVGWVSGGFCEELFFRGHLIHLTRTMLGGSRWAAAAALVISTVYFGYSHSYQGTTGMIDTGMAAIVFGLLYLWRGRLIAPMVAHGLYDMLLIVGMALLYQ
ncbi:MAG: CPBP family intramembrane glutamic endopeptidase [Vulcanimicrobiota bacterium]